MNVYCVVVTYNGAHWVKKCFESLRFSTLPVHTVVVDNLSTDDTVKLLTVDFPEVELIKNSRNLGFGVANNLGIKMAIDAGADFIFLLNQDAWIEADAIERLVDVGVANPGYGILSPIHLSGDGMNLDEQFATYVSPPSCSFFNDLYRNEVGGLYSCGFVNAAAWLLSRNCVNAVGLFEPMFFLYGEDFNYTQRLRYHLLALGVVPSARIVHDRLERKGEKSANGKEIDAQTFIYTKLFNINGTISSNLIEALKVFVKHPFSKSFWQLAKAIYRLDTIQDRIAAHRKQSYLLN